MARTIDVIIECKKSSIEWGEIDVALFAAALDWGGKPLKSPVGFSFAMDEKYSPRIQTAVAVLLIASKKAPAGNTQKNGPMPDRSAISGHMSEHNPRTAYNVNVVTTLTSNDATKTWLAFEFSLGNMTALSYESGRKLADMPIAAMTTAATP